MKLPHALLVMCVLLGAALAACSPNPGGAASSAPLAKASWNECAASIQSQKGLSASTAPTFNASNVKTLQNDQFVVIMYYNQTSTLYRCSLQQHSDGSWQLVHLDSMVPEELTVWNLKR